MEADSVQPPAGKREWQSLAFSALPVLPTGRSLGHCHQQHFPSALWSARERQGTGYRAKPALAAPPKQEEAELRGSVRAHLIGLVQVLQVQVLNEVIHDVQVIILSCKVESVHSFLKRARVKK